MANQLVKKATIKPHTSFVRLSLLFMCCWSDTDCVCRCMGVRFRPTALWWQLAVMTSHSASPTLPRRQKCTLRSVMVKYVPIYCFFSDHLVKLYGGIAWSPDGTRLVAVTYSGSVIQVTNNKAHSTVYKINTPVCIMFAALSLLIPCLVVGMRIQSPWDRCRRWI